MYKQSSLYKELKKVAQQEFSDGLTFNQISNQIQKSMSKLNDYGATTVHNYKFLKDKENVLIFVIAGPDDIAKITFTFKDYDSLPGKYSLNSLEVNGQKVVSDEDLELKLSYKLNQKINNILYTTRENLALLSKLYKIDFDFEDKIKKIKK